HLALALEAKLHLGRVHLEVGGLQFLLEEGTDRRLLIPRVHLRHHWRERATVRREDEVVAVASVPAALSAGELRECVVEAPADDVGDDRRGRAALWELVVDAAYLRNDGCDRWRQGEGRCHEHAPHPPEMNGWEEILEVDTKNPAPVLVAARVLQDVCALHVSEDAGPWLVLRFEHLGDALLQLLERKDRGANPAFVAVALLDVEVPVPLLGGQAV